MEKIPSLDAGLNIWQGPFTYRLLMSGKILFKIIKVKKNMFFRSSRPVIYMWKYVIVSNLTYRKLNSSLAFAFCVGAVLQYC